MTKIVPTVPLRKRLMVIALAAVLPVAIAAGIGLLALVRGQFRAADAKSLEVTRLAASAIDTEFTRSTAVLHVAGASPLLDQRDFASYWILLKRTIDEMSGWDGLVLTTADGQAIVDTRVPFGTAPPAYEVTESFRRAVEGGRPVTGQITQSEPGRWLIPLHAPILRDGEVRYVLTALMTPAPFVNVVNAQNLPDDWVLSVFDSHQARVARSREHDRFVGQPPAQSLTALLADPRPSGTGITRTLEGIEVYTAYVRMPASGWTVAMGLPTADVESAALRALAYFGGGTIASILIALMLASFAARRISGPIRELQTAAERLGHGDVPSVPPTAIEELATLGRSLADAGTAREHIEGERRATLAELIETRDDLRQQVSDLERLHRLTNELLNSSGLGPQLDAVLRALCELHGAPRGLVSLAAPDDTGLRLQASRGFSPDACERLSTVKAGEGACGASFKDDCRVVIEDTERDPRFAPFRDLARTEGFRAVHSTPIRASGGRLLGVLAVHAPQPGVPTARQVRLADLCAHLCGVFVERALAQAEAQKSERRLAVALDSSIVPFSILSPVRDGAGAVVDFTWEHTNRAAAGAISRKPAELIGRPVASIVPEVWQIPGLFDACVSVAETGLSRELEVSATNVKPTRWLHVVATPVDGKVAIWTADITERKRQEAAQQEADRRKDEFLAILAHELRNPLAPIQQAAMIASETGASEAQQRWSHSVIVRQVKQMSLLLDDLLDVSRITRGKLELRKARIALNDAIDAAVETARPHFEAKGHQLILSLPREPIQLTADALRVAQVVTNLLTNAARYTEAGGVVRLAARADGRRAVVTVADNGAGIPASSLDSIFEMFAQGRPDGQNGGLGIGLALSRGLAQLHGGTLVAASDGPGKGSRFTLTLPLGEAAPLVVAEPALHATPSSLRILVADDNRDAAETLASLLRLNGHRVIVAYDGETALVSCLEEKPDAVILDIGMPRLSGYEVARRIRAMAPAGSAPLLIALTGWGQARDKASAVAAGFDHHLTKPVDPRALFALLSQLSRRPDPPPPYDLGEASGEKPPVTH